MRETRDFRASFLPGRLFFYQYLFPYVITRLVVRGLLFLLPGFIIIEGFFELAFSLLIRFMPHARTPFV